ncbi:hypothetical protein Salat_0655800 [Sesamum alatum]|uniref:Uncharacterized protein n=1 Tax=Sesamum alatum TaxID=300844 RepID=A0AAE2CUH4_9LAMI|nr:hypothetical protein Salat_0655800 [Sesamum alatum]
MDSRGKLSDLMVVTFEVCTSLALLPRPVLLTGRRRLVRLRVRLETRWNSRDGRRKCGILLGRLADARTVALESSKMKTAITIGILVGRVHLVPLGPEIDEALSSSPIRVAHLSLGVVVAPGPRLRWLARVLGWAFQERAQQISLLTSLVFLLITLLLVLGRSWLRFIPPKAQKTRGALPRILSL